MSATVMKMLLASLGQRFLLRMLRRTLVNLRPYAKETGTGFDDIVLEALIASVGEEESEAAE